MQSVPSALSLVAVGLYMAVAGGTLMAWSRAFQQRQAAWHSQAWVAISLMFLVFGLMRVLGVEDMLQSDLRSTFEIEQRYEERRALQGPLVALIFIVAAALGAGLFYYIAKGVKGRRNIITVVAVGCTGGMIVLALLRLISLHSVDALLYGPLKINWIADLGLTLAVLGCAVRYRTVVR